MAISANGYIARENNEEDFISHASWTAWLKAVRNSGCFIWGRKTYEIVGSWSDAYLNDLKGLETIVVTTNHNYSVRKGFRVATSPEEAKTVLESSGYSSAVLTGGSKINSSFAKLGLIDELLLNIEPVIVGKGIPLFAPDLFDLKLEYKGMRRSEGQTLQLEYRVIK